MKGLIGTILVVLSLPVLTSAQSDEYSRGHGYAYFAPTVSSPSSVTYAHIGGGGEGFFTRNLGAGADLGYFTPMERWSNGIGTFSPNFVARFRAKDVDNKIEPSLPGGYTLFSRSGTASGFKFGGGISYWLKDRFGLRFEVRDNVWAQSETIHYVGFRVGVTFR